MKYIVVLLIIALFTCGCPIQRGDFKATFVIEGQPAPHDGYNIGPEIYVLEGEPVKMGGAVVWVKGLDPNIMVIE